MSSTPHATVTPSIPATSSLVNTGACSLHVTTYAGNGPQLLLIHGIGSSSAAWNTVIEDLARDFSPITVDLRGHGESDKPESGYLYDDYVGDIDGLLSALDIPTPLVVGHSLGGIVALWWAAKHPSRAAALVIEDSPLRSGEDFRPAFDGWLRLNAMPVDTLTEYYLGENPSWSPKMAAARARTMTTTKRAVFAELREDSLANDGNDRIEEITKITSPALLIHGDPETGSKVHPEDVAAFSNRLPNARTYRIPGGGHTLHRSFREGFLAAAVPFLKEWA